MTKHIISNKEITRAIKELVKEAFSELGVKLADVLSAVEVEYMGSPDLQDILAVSDALAVRLDEILAAHCRSLAKECSKLEVALKEEVA